MDIYFKVRFMQCGEFKELNFSSIHEVRSFLFQFIYPDSICWIKDIEVTRRYVSFNHDPEFIDLEDVLFHWGVN